VKVRDVMKLVEADGWYYVETKGSHRQYEHPVKKGKVTIAGHPSDEMKPKTLHSVVVEQAQIDKKKIQKGRKKQ
jgi:predicted RNA binding protein YcfA (HicA-like mRNA interferase family)